MTSSDSDSLTLTRMPTGWGPLALRGMALTYIAVLVLIPVAVIVHDGLREGLGGLARAVSTPVARSALWLTAWTAALTGAINAVAGTATAWVLVRYRFPGRALLSAVVDLPVALPTLVTGVMLVVLYGPQAALGGAIERALGVRVLFAPPGIVLALLFISFPFVVRAVQPVLLALDRDPEDAAATLGAGAFTVFRRITLPALVAPVTSGTLLTCARALGEFGSIVIVAGNIPLRSQTAAVYVLGEIESENRLGASAVSLVLLAGALTLILVVDLIQRRRRRVR